MSIIAIIPARGGSKRLPGKNLLDLNGIPLMAHSIRYAKAQPEITEVYVTTDDPEIALVARQFGAEVIDRPRELAGDHEPTVSAVAHVLETIAQVDPLVVLLQPTNPLRPASLIGECLAEFTKNDASGLFTVSRNHHKLGTIDNGMFIPYNYTPGQRSQDLKPLFYENGLLYISRAETIRSGNVISQNALPFIVDHVFGSVDIDTADDLEYARYLIEKHHS